VPRSVEARGGGAQGPAGGARAAALLAALVLGSAIWASVLTIGHASAEVYGIPGWGVALTLVLLSATVAGCGLVASSRQPAFSAVVLAGAALGVTGLLAILSFGALALLAAAGLAGWAGTRRWPGGRSGRAAAGAVLAGAPLPLLVVFATAGPLVDCEPDGVTTRGHLFVGLESTGVASGGGGAGDGDVRGRGEGSRYAYSYVCREGRLVQFDLRRR
jgi:hypothetical protein